ELPRSGRRVADGQLELTTRSGNRLRAPLAHTDEHGRRFAVLSDQDGHRAFGFEDGMLTLAEAPVSGFDAALVFLENGGVRPEEKWRWHSVIGHDLFL